MAPPFRVVPRKSSRSTSPEKISKSIVEETPPSTKTIKTPNLKLFTFSKLKSATKSKINGLMKSNGSKSPENRSKSIVNEIPPSIGNIKTLNLKVFTFAEVKSATGNFRQDWLLGEGGFGQVFKGWVQEKMYKPSKLGVGMPVAVKKCNPDSMQGFREWLTEIEFLGNLSHPNIVKLVGYCSEEDNQFLLVYEYAPKGSLENHLFKGDAEPLPWGLRLKIAIGAARGLAFLHTSEKPVIYRDFKTSNILLDGDYNAKLSDFGLATHAPSIGNTQVTTQIKGTLGPTSSDTQVITQISWPNGDTQVTTQIRGMLGSASSDTQLTTQISWSNRETLVTTQIKSMLGSTNSDMHVTTQIRGMSNVANDNKHVTTNIRTCPANDDTHVTTEIGGVLHPPNSGSHMSTRVVGTYGYAAPEYTATGHLYVKSDVYSFGVVLLEILTGLQVIDKSRSKEMQNLVEWTKPFLSCKKKLTKIMDQRLQDRYPPKGAYQAAQLALKCLKPHPQNRPSMVEVLENLEQINAL